MNINFVDDFDENVSLAEIDIVSLNQIDAHGTYYSKESVDKAKETLSFKPINMIWNGRDFEGHAFDEFDERRKQCIGTTIITDKYQPHYIEKDGKTYLRCYALIWKFYYYNALQRMAINDKEIGSTSISMEVSIYKKHEEKGVIYIDDFVFDAITVLGRNIKPAIDGADIKILRYSDNNGIDIIAKTKEYVERFMYSKERDDKVEDENKELEQQEEYACGDKKEEYACGDKKKGYEEKEQEKCSEETPTDSVESNSAEQEDYQKCKKEYQELQTKYSELQNKYEALKSEMTSLNEKYSTLTSDFESQKVQYSELEGKFTSTMESYSTLTSNYEAQTKELDELKQYKYSIEKDKLIKDADNFFGKFETYVSADEKKMLYSKLEESGLDSFKREVSFMVLPRMESINNETKKQCYSFPIVNDNIVQKQEQESEENDTYGFKKFIKNLN